MKRRAARPPRILILSPVFPPARGGIETLTHGIAERLALVAEVQVVTLAEPDSVEWDAESPLHVSRAANEPRGGRRALCQVNLLALLTAIRFRPTVVLSMHVRNAAGAAAIRAMTGARWAQYYHAKEIAYFDSSARWAARSADVQIAVSSYTAGLVAAAGAAPESISVIAPAVPPVVRTVRSMADRAPIMLTLSRLADEYKGHDVLIDALPEIFAGQPTLRWVIVGDGQLRPALQARVAASGYADRVEFRGQVSDAERDELLAGAAIFALPSRVPPRGLGGEGFGIVYLEAAAAGLPVVAGDVGGSVDAVSDGQTGLCVAADDPAAVATAVRRLLTEPGLADRMSANGPQWAASFTWDRLMSSLQPLLGIADAEAVSPAERHQRPATKL